MFRGGSAGFTVLLVGELLALALGAVSASLGGLLFAVTAAAGPVTAGTAAGQARPAVPNGLAAGLLAYGLTVPLRFMIGSRPEVTELVFSVVISAGLGAVGGRMAARAAGGAK